MLHFSWLEMKAERSAAGLLCHRRILRCLRLSPALQRPSPDLDPCVTSQCMGPSNLCRGPQATRGVQRKKPLQPHFAKWKCEIITTPQKSHCVLNSSCIFKCWMFSTGLCQFVVNNIQVTGHSSYCEAARQIDEGLLANVLCTAFANFHLLNLQSLTLLLAYIKLNCLLGKHSTTWAIP
jgi:hypothetical protein